MTIKIGVLFLLLAKPGAEANEWETSGGEHCIDECRRWNEDLNFYWCHTTDLKRSHHSGSAGDGWALDMPKNPDKHAKWDYCTPSQPDDSALGLDPEQRPAKTSLFPQTDCLGECASDGHKLVCQTETHDPEGLHGNWFYCSRDTPLKREQLSANDMLWCIDACRSQGNGDFSCKTLFGTDFCSPYPGATSKGQPCTTDCELYGGFGGDYFFCYTSLDNSTWDYCGNWDVSTEAKSSLKFSTDGEVCADPCRLDKKKEYSWCHTVQWRYNSTLESSQLHLTWNYCLGYAAPPWSMKSILITAGSIAGGLILVCGLIYCCKKKQQRYSTV